MERMNSAFIMALDFFKKVNGFKEQPEAKQSGDD